MHTVYIIYYTLYIQHIATIAKAAKHKSPLESQVKRFVLSFPLSCHWQYVRSALSLEQGPRCCTHTIGRDPKVLQYYLLQTDWPTEVLGTLLVACFSKTICRPRSVGESPSGCCLQVGTLLRHLASNFTNSVMMTTMTIMMVGTMTTTTMTMKVMSFTSSAICSHKLTNGAAKSSTSMFLLISSTYDLQSVVANLIKTFLWSWPMDKDWCGIFHTFTFTLVKRCGMETKAH